MSYQLRNDIEASSGEAVIQLDTDDLVAVRCDRAAANGAIVFTARARAINADGSERITAAGVPIATVLTHQDRNAATADAVAKDCLLAVLGEPPLSVAWGADLLRDASIRNAISINNVTTTVDPAQVL